MLELEGWGVTDVGRQRSQNQDALVCDPALGLYAVCDGMGGMAAGDVASKIAASVLLETVRQHRPRLAGIADPAPRADRAWVLELLESAVQRACQRVFEDAMKNPDRKGMGTTMTALLAVGGRGFAVHVGDSRAYVLRRGKLHTLTEDHTVIGEMIKAGRVTPEQAKDLPYHGALSRAVGVQPSVKADRLEFQLCDGDRFLLCSDGLTAYAGYNEVQALLGHDPVDSVAQTGVNYANESGGRDNVTVVVFTVAAQPEHPSFETAAPEQFQLRFETLREIPLFRDLTDREVLKLMAFTDERVFAAGETLIREGEPGEDLLVVLEGSAQVSKDGVAIAEVTRGGHVGEMALLDDAPRSATVCATEQTHAFVIRRDQFVKLLRSDSGLANKILWCFLHMLSGRLRTTSDELTVAQSRARRLTEVPNIFD